MEEEARGEDEQLWDAGKGREEDEQKRYEQNNWKITDGL